MSPAGTASSSNHSSIGAGPEGALAAGDRLTDGDAAPHDLANAACGDAQGSGPASLAAVVGWAPAPETMANIAACPGGWLAKAWTNHAPF
jgi:hypothetical protein